MSKSTAAKKLANDQIRRMYEEEPSGKAPVTEEPDDGAEEQDEEPSDPSEE